MDYCINCLKCTGLSALAILPFFIGSMFKTPGMIIGGVIAFLGMVPVMYFGFFNMFKRLRDIRGTTENQTIFIIVVYSFMLIPYIGLIPGLCLLFIEGKVTGSGSGLGKIENIFSSNPSEIEGEEKVGIDNIEKLFKLKESGAITEEEFENYKKEALQINKID